MKKLLIIVMLFSLSISKAQVGVNTNTPRSALDIQGSLTVRGNLRVAGTDQAKGQTGRLLNLLVSNGTNQVPEWKSLKIPIVKANRYYLLFANSFSDRVGIKPTTLTGASAYTYGMSLPSSGWSTIGNLTQNFTVTNPTNKLFVFYEAVAQINSSAQYNGLDFTCGIFVDDQLIGARTIDLYQATASGTNIFRTFTVIGTTESSLVAGTHQIKVACTRRSNYGSFSDNFSVGVEATGTSNIDSFMAQSSLRVEVYEVPEVFLNIVN